RNGEVAGERLRVELEHDNVRQGPEEVTAVLDEGAAEDVAHGRSAVPGLRIRLSTAAPTAAAIACAEACIGTRTPIDAVSRLPPLRCASAADASAVPTAAATAPPNSRAASRAIARPGRTMRMRRIEMSCMGHGPQRRRVRSELLERHGPAELVVLPLHGDDDALHR